MRRFPLITRAKRWTVLPELYVSDFTGEAIRVYNQFLGDAAPVRTITSPFMGQPRQLVLIPEHNELLVITSMNFVSTFALDADGTATRLRTIGVFPNPVSGLDNPAGLAFNSATDEIYVGDYQFDGVSTYSAEVLVFPRTASGDVAPEKIIRGAQTGAGLNDGWFSVLAVDFSFIFADGFEN